MEDMPEESFDLTQAMRAYDGGHISEQKFDAILDLLQPEAPPIEEQATQEASQQETTPIEEQATQEASQPEAPQLPSETRSAEEAPQLPSETRSAEEGTTQPETTPIEEQATPEASQEAETTQPIIPKEAWELMTDKDKQTSLEDAKRIGLVPKDANIDQWRKRKQAGGF